MNQLARTAGIIFIFIILPGSVCLAEISLLGMSNTRQEKVNHVIFVFDSVPEFEVKHSGQRVRVELTDTDFVDSFTQIAERDLHPPLSAVKTHRQGQNGIVDLYFRNIPEFVDVTVDQSYARFTVNVFWDSQRSAIRPGIFDQRFGSLQSIDHGAAARQMIFSEYAGRWKDFFAEFQWTPQWDLPFELSLPPFLGPLVMENRVFLPDALMELIIAGRWSAANEQITQLLQEEPEGRQADLYRLLLAESFLRQNLDHEALSCLAGIESGPQQSRINAWHAYYRIYATAAMSEYHRAARLAEEHGKSILQEKSLAPWFSILEAEIYLSMNEPENALHALEINPEYFGASQAIASLHKGDALYDQGKAVESFKHYRKIAADLQLIGQHPASLARYASLIYDRQEYQKAYRYFFLLSGILKKKKSEQKFLAGYWAAMARMQSGQAMRARLMLWEIEQAAPYTEAGLRARLKSMDLDIVEKQAPDFGALLPAYDSIIQQAEGKRQIREEAFFKQILACHLGGNNLVAVRQLGRFFDDYWAGELMPDARALFVEIFPSAIRAMVEQKAYFEALTLVSKHRELLAEAPITYDFLHDLAQSYTRAGFLDQAAKTYLYLMDFEKDEARKSRIYLPLIQTLDHLDSHLRVQRHASDYLSRFPEGEDRMEVFYHYARSVAKTGSTEAAASMLLENKRPIHKKIDLLTGSLFFDKKQYGLAACYLGRASALAAEGSRHAIDLKRAEALFHLQRWEQAASLYESLLNADECKGQAAFRLLQTYLNLGLEQKALNFYQQMSEMEIEETWVTVSAQAIETRN